MLYRRLASLSCLVLGVFLVLGGTVNGDDAQDTKDIVGKWTHDYTGGLHTLEFTKDGKLIETQTLILTITSKYKWKISNGKLVTVDESGKVKKREITVVGDTLKIEFTNANGNQAWEDWTKKE